VNQANALRLTSRAMTGDAPFVLALDLGTSSTRAMVFDANGVEVPDTKSQVAHALRTSGDGAAVFDPAALLREVEACLDATLRAFGGEVTAVATSQLVTNLLAVDENGAPLTPVLTYADTRCAAEVETLRAEIDERAVHARTGCRLHSSYWPPRFRWLTTAQPALMAQRPRWLSVAEWIHLRLTGGALCSRSVASWTGLFNRTAGTWDAGWLDALGLTAEQFAPIASDDDALAGLTHDHAQRWPQLAGAAWLPPVSDGVASNIGSGCLNAARVALSVGTSGAMRVVVPSAELGDALPFGAACYQLDGARSLPACALNDAGSVFAWLKETLRIHGEGADLESELAFLPPLDHGVTMLPFLTGERSPGWNPRAHFVLHGATAETQPIELLQAGLEAVALRFAACHEVLQPFIAPDAEVIASGGGLLNSPTWTQMMADALGRPVVASAETEPSARGAALLALEALGARRLSDLTTAFGATFEPRPALTERYRAALKVQTELYGKMLG